MTHLPPATSGGSLRERFIADMTVRGFTEKTRKDYLRTVAGFAAFLARSPGTATAEDIRWFQIQRSERGMSAPAMNSAVAALCFFFTITADRPDLSRKLIRLRCPRKLPVVLSSDEAARLIAHCLTWNAPGRGSAETGMRRISMTARDELVRAVSERCGRASREERGHILDEFTAVTGLHRKHAVRLLCGGAPIGRCGPRPGRRVYDVAMREALIVVWEAWDRVCGKRLRPLVPLLVDAMERHGHLIGAGGAWRAAGDERCGDRPGAG